MNVKTRNVLLLVMLLGLLPATGNAAIITYSSRVAFATGVVGEIVENWDGLTDDTVILVLDGITYDPSGGDAIVTDEFLALSPPNTLGSTSTGLVSFFGGTETMTFTFSFPISAFGISFNTFAPTDGAYSATTNLGDVALSFYDPFPGFSTGQFVGFSSDTPFTSVTLTPLTGFPYNLDDLNYLPTTVPEPSTLLLFGFGAAAAACRRRR